MKKKKKSLLERIKTEPLRREGKRRGRKPKNLDLFYDYLERITRGK